MGGMDDADEEACFRKNTFDLETEFHRHQLVGNRVEARSETALNTKLGVRSL